MAKAWIIQKEYGDIQLVVDLAGQAPVYRYILQRKESGGVYQVIKEINVSEVQNGNYSYLDLSLTENKSYTYQVIAYDSNGRVLAVSNEVTI